MREIDGVLDDIDFRVEVGGNVDRGVGDYERFRVAGYVHDEAVADPALGADAAFPRDYRAHEFIGVEAALHQRLDPASGDEADRFRC